MPFNVVGKITLITWIFYRSCDHFRLIISSSNSYPIAPFVITFKKKLPTYFGIVFIMCWIDFSLLLK